MMLLLYRNVPFKGIVILFPMVYYVLKNFLIHRCHVINNIWSKEVLILGHIYLPDIELTLNNLALCPSGII